MDTNNYPGQVPQFEAQAQVGVNTNFHYPQQDVMPGFQPIIPQQMPPQMPMMNQPIYSQQPMGQPMYQQPMQQPMMQQPMMPQPMMGNPQIVIQANNQTRLLTCMEIFVQCIPPQMKTCQHCCGCCTACSCGGGLITGACCGCYGCERQDCCQICGAGCLMDISSSFVIGIISGCMTGCRMMEKM